MWQATSLSITMPQINLNHLPYSTTKTQRKHAEGRTHLRIPPLGLHSWSVWNSKAHSALAARGPGSKAWREGPHHKRRGSVQAGDRCCWFEGRWQMAVRDHQWFGKGVATSRTFCITWVFYSNEINSSDDWHKTIRMGPSVSWHVWWVNSVPWVFLWMVMNSWSFIYLQVIALNVGPKFSLNLSTCNKLLIN